MTAGVRDVIFVTRLYYFHVTTCNLKWWDLVQSYCLHQWSKNSEKKNTMTLIQDFETNVGKSLSFRGLEMIVLTFVIELKNMV